jgi:hypothetical protein
VGHDFSWTVVWDEVVSSVLAGESEACQ